MARIRTKFEFPKEVTSEAEQCIVCGAVTTFCCSRCRRVFYCSQSCQRLDWRSHKLTCSETTNTPPPVSLPPPSSMPEQVISLEAQVSMYERATETLKQSLLARFGSIIGAYEWFDTNTGGCLDIHEFERTLLAGGVAKASVVKEMFSALDRPGSGRISVSDFLAEAVKKLNIRTLDENFPPSTAPRVIADDKKVERPSDPSTLPPGRRALRAASILAFRNGRYDDAIVSSLQALGITSPGARWVSSVPKHPDSLVELMLLSRIFAVSKQLQRGEPFMRLVGEIFSPESTAMFPPHVHVTLLCSVGELMDQYNLRAQAFAYLNKYLEMTLMMFGVSSLVYGDALTVVSGYHARIGAFLEALSLASKALDIRVTNLKPPHARLADSYLNRGILCKALGKVKDAIIDLKEAAEQRVKLFGASSVPVADAFFVLGTCEGFIEAEKYLSAAHAVRVKLLGPTHVDTLTAAAALRQLKPVPPQEKENDKPPQPPQPAELEASKYHTQNSVFKDLLIQSSDNLADIAIPDTVVSSDSETSQSSSLSSSSSEAREGHISPLPTVSMIKLPTKSVDPSKFSRAKSIVVLPESPFREAQQRMGNDLFLQRLVVLDESLVGTTANFSLQSVMPTKAGDSFWVPLAMKAVYAKRVIAEELGPESDGSRITTFMNNLKQSEQDIRLVFHLLNGIFTNLKQQQGSRVFTTPSKSFSSRQMAGLTVINFSDFINSRTQNVALMEYFTKLLKSRYPEVYYEILERLACVKKVGGIDIADYMARLTNVKKSIDFVHSDLSQLSATAAAGPSMANILAIVPEVSSLKKILTERAKSVAQGVAFIGELFRAAKQSEVVDKAVECIEELYDQLKSNAELIGDKDISDVEPMSPQGSQIKRKSIIDNAKQNSTSMVGKSIITVAMPIESDEDDSGTSPSASVDSSNRQPVSR